MTAFVLAGGKSSRMGRDKAFIEFEGETLLARSLKLAKSVAEQVSIVGATSKFAQFGRVIEDVYRNCGPLGGIHAALSTATTELNLILAVDLPFLHKRLLEHLIDEARKSDALVTVPQMRGFEPLCAIYRKRFAALAEDALRNGRYKIDVLFAKIEPRIVGEEELTRAGFSPEVFGNLNTPEDVEEAARRKTSAGDQV